MILPATTRKLSNTRLFMTKWCKNVLTRRVAFILYVASLSCTDFPGNHSWQLQESKQVVQTEDTLLVTGFSHH